MVLWSPKTKLKCQTSKLQEQETITVNLISLIVICLQVLGVSKVGAAVGFGGGSCDYLSDMRRIFDFIP